MNLQKIALLICLSAICSGNATQAQQNQEVNRDDTDTKVTGFEDLKYPVLAQNANIQGVVVVQVRLDDHGKAIEAQAISGPKILALPALENVKKWRFQPNPQHSAVIIYNFTILPGRCMTPDSVFTLQGKNLANVVGCSPVLNL